jgi:outer membrane lipoprotein-sorting protein
MSLRMMSAFFFSACLTLMAQETTGTAILRHTAEAYRALRSERVEATVVMDAKTYHIETSIIGAIVRPDKFRLEIISSMMGSETISDGHSVWKYVAGFGQYTRKPASPGILPVPNALADILIGEKISIRLDSAKLVRREKLTVGGKEVNCDVIEAAYTPDVNDSGPARKKTFWVDVHHRLILRVSSFVRIGSEAGGTKEISQSITVTSIKLNEPLRDSLFVFQPLEGAKEVAELKLYGQNTETR